MQSNRRNYQHTLIAGLEMRMGDNNFKGDKEARRFWKKEIKKLVSRKCILLPASFVLHIDGKVVYRHKFMIPALIETK